MGIGEKKSIPEKKRATARSNTKQRRNTHVTGAEKALTTAGRGIRRQ